MWARTGTHANGPPPMRAAKKPSRTGLGNICEVLWAFDLATATRHTVSSLQHAAIRRRIQVTMRKGEGQQMPRISITGPPAGNRRRRCATLLSMRPAWASI